MKKTIVIACVAALLIGVVAAGANAAVGNWIVGVKAYSEAWTGADKSVTIGLGTAAATVASGTAAANKVEALATDGTAVWTKKVLASATTSGNFDLKIGQGGGFNAVQINLYNIATGTLGVNTALDTNLVYTFKNGETVLATFSSAANRNNLAAGSLGVAATGEGYVAGWFDVGLLMKPTGWSNSAADRGWFYVDTTPVTNTAFLSLENYSFSFAQPTPVPEPGSMLALGSGLVGMAGFAIRRRRA